MLAEFPDDKVTFVIHDELLLITTKDKAKNLLVTKLYDVADLVVCQDSKARFWDDYETLTDVIREATPESWELNGGQGTVKGATAGGGQSPRGLSDATDSRRDCGPAEGDSCRGGQNRGMGVDSWPQRDPPRQRAIRTHGDVRQ